MTEIKLNKKEEKELFFKALLGSPFFNIFASVLATFIVGAIFLKFGGGVPINVTQTSVTKTSTFDVEGEGRVVVKPDMAVVRFGVEREGVEVVRIQKEVGRVMDQLRLRLVELGVNKAEIKTVSYLVHPHDKKKGVFVVNVIMEVRVKDLDKVGQVLDLVGELGLTQVGGVRFSLSEELETKVKREAREKAVKLIKKKAKELASLAGMKLGKIVNVKEGVSWGGYREPIMSVDSLKRNENEVSLSPGTNEVRVTMTVSWEVE